MTDNNKFDLSKLNPNINNIKLKDNIDIKSFINLNRLNMPSVKAPEIDTSVLIPKDKPKERKALKKFMRTM